VIYVEEVNPEYASHESEEDVDTLETMDDLVISPPSTHPQQNEEKIIFEINSVSDLVTVIFS